jgi:FkbM family methyltransferase
VDISWLMRNIKASWRHRGSFLAFFARIFFVYSDRLPRFMRRPAWVISFHYPQPIGSVRLLLRANKGADSFIHGEVFEHNYYRFELPCTPTTILDLGANIGMTAIYFHRCFPDAELACVEPMPRNLSILQENIRLNSVKATIVSGAVHPVDGCLVMEVNRKDYGHRVAKPGERSGEQYIEVPAFSVPTLLGMLKWNRIGLLKIDIEGHESVLLSENASWLDLVDSMCIECHNDFSSNDLRSLTRSFGFLPPEQLPGIWLLRRSNGIRLEQPVSLQH